ncbi:hypothetical protein [Tichowtungia aerotolerans]|uniref:Uncharacterized protein n=1 Tax=Tichowtungia aerotolerans TaxID=2697043 RepID=A0A6P1M8G9_9BACT|nr:hypothetical protein [Tichowtungia aerotolerans]QHI68418.1 hypothetical protein GT409_02755 [Tichowtungia aerotolerans]
MDVSASSEMLEESKKQTRYLKEIHNLIGFIIAVQGILIIAVGAIVYWKIYS